MNEHDTHHHRICQSWKVFHKWGHILMAHRTPLKSRLEFWRKTVCGSLDWCLETCRRNTNSLKLLYSAQCLQVAKMMGLKRKVLPDKTFEPWLDWHKRRYQTASQVIQAHSIDIRSIMSEKRLSWNSHISRFGTDNRSMHLVKLILHWRPLAWWRLQQQAIANSTSSFRHPCQFTPRRWEEQFKQIHPHTI
jgi:hypothetical protein